MPQYNWVSLPLPRSAFPLPKSLKKKGSSTRVALLLVVLLVFAAAAFGLAATA